jgi:hypothetical protein
MLQCIEPNETDELLLLLGPDYQSRWRQMLTGRAVIHLLLDALSINVLPTDALLTDDFPVDAPLSIFSPLVFPRPIFS